MLRIFIACMVLLNILMFVSCQDSASSDGNVKGDITHYNATKEAENVLKVDGKLFSIPSPIQTSVFIKENGSGFNQDLLLSASALDVYQSGSEKAIALGIYGAQLGYVSLYNEDDRSFTYMNTCRKLSDDIGVSGAFNESLVNRFTENMGVPDTMIVIVSEIYEAADVYLKSNERNDVAALVLFGGWIESLNITCQEATLGSDAIIGRLAEQAEGFERLKDMMTKYGDAQIIKEIQPMLDDLSEAFTNVNSSYIYQKPLVNLESQTTTLKSEVIYEMDEETMNSIIAHTTALRNHITGTK